MTKSTDRRHLLKQFALFALSTAMTPVFSTELKEGR